MNKKVVMSIIVLCLFVFLVGCLDYKAYDVPKEDTTEEEMDLIDEIAAIENELGLEEEPAEAEETTTEEVVVEETTEEETTEEELPKEVPEEIADENATEEVENEIVEEEIVVPKPEEKEMASTDTSDTPVITVKENELVKLNVKVADPDGDTVTHSFSMPLNNEGSWQTNYGDAGEYFVTVSATDGKLTSKQKVKIVVERVNVPPTIKSVEDMKIKEGAVAKYVPDVSDPNGDLVKVSVSEPLASGEFVTDHTSAGEYRIEIVATDGELETKESFLLTIEDVNILPKVSGINDLTVKEGDVVMIKPVVTDLDEDAITITIGEPVGNDGVWETGYTDHGTYNIKVTVSDGKDTVTKTVKLIVEDVNMPPEIVDVYVGPKK